MPREMRVCTVLLALAGCSAGAPPPHPAPPRAVDACAPVAATRPFVATSGAPLARIEITACPDHVAQAVAESDAASNAGDLPLTEVWRREAALLIPYRCGKSIRVTILDEAQRPVPARRTAGGLCVDRDASFAVGFDSDGPARYQVSQAIEERTLEEAVITAGSGRNFRGERRDGPPSYVLPLKFSGDERLGWPELERVVFTVRADSDH